MKSRNTSKRLWLPPPEFYEESLCHRCGICCGSTDGHPCEHLRRDAEGLYFCETYETRLGRHHTVDGMEFICVPIRMIIENGGGYDACGYVHALRRLREQMGQDVSDLGRREKP